MEILVPKISAEQECANHYQGVIAYGKGADGKSYVLKICPENNKTKWFVILKANQTNVSEIFKYDDEQGDGIVFSWYDEAIEGFEYFLNAFCLQYNK